VSLALALAATGCDDAPATRRSHGEIPTSPTGAYTAEPVLGGSLSGRVAWVGPAPADVVVHGSMDPELCGADPSVPVLVLGARGGVLGSVVVVTGVASAPTEIPSDPVVLSASNCSFAPHVLALHRGTRLRVENADPILHDARAIDGRGTVRFDLGLATLGASSELALDEPGILRVVDDAGHPGMLAWVHVVEHPYFAVTDAEGRFRIPSIPPGTYTVQMWHEGVRANADGSISAPMLLTRTVTILGGHDTSADFELDASVAEAAGD
jgi:hypothetical protein